jgi:hypothetical protein
VTQQLGVFTKSFLARIGTVVAVVALASASGVTALASPAAAQQDPVFI